MTQPRVEPAPMRWRTIPNLISVVRLLVFVPLTLWLIFQPGMQLWATVSLVAFGATDWIDGLLARLLHQVSRVGEILDPVADRLGIILIALGMAISGYLPWFVIIVIVASDAILLVLGAMRLEHARAGRTNLLGKFRTALLMTAMPLHLLSFAPEIPAEPLRSITFWMLVAGTFAHVAAMLVYAKRLFVPAHG